MKTIDPNKAEEFARDYLKNWDVVDNGTRLRKRVTFSDYNHAVRFLLAIEKKMTDMDHFIDLAMFYDEMMISLYTHDANALTKDDFKLAIYLDRKLADMDVE
jgi:4a-hydroxytetrahydrobiopterin dehydratase